MRIYLLATMALLTGATALSIPARSAEPEPGATTEGEIPEVTVYAERKASGQSAREVPMSVSAINGDLIDQAKLLSVVDVGRLAPNTQLDPVGTFPGFSNFSIRGVGNSNSTRSIDSPVNVIQDGLVIDYQPAPSRNFDLRA